MSHLAVLESKLAKPGGVDAGGGPLPGHVRCRRSDARTGAYRKMPHASGIAAIGLRLAIHGMVAQLGINKFLDVAIEDALGLENLVAVAMILHAAVIEDVAANL